MTRNTIITTTTTKPAIHVRLWRRFVLPHSGLALMAVPVMVVVAAATTAYPLLVSFAFELLEAKDPRIFTLIPVALVLAATIKAIALYIQVLLTNALGLRVVRDLQNAMFTHVQELDMAQLDAEPDGLLVSRFTNDVNLAKEALVRASNNLVRDLLVVIGAMAAMLYLNWQLALIIVVIYPVATLPVVWLGRRVRALSVASQHQIGELTALLSESIAGMKMVRTFALEAHEQKRAKAGFMARYQLAIRLTATKAAVDPFLEVLGALALSAVLGFAGWRAISGVSAIPELMGFITALATLAPSARALGTLNAIWQEGMAAMGRAFALLDKTPQIVTSKNAKPLTVTKAMVELDRVNFAYENDELVLKALSLKAYPGQTLALVGPSGAGKSSVFHMILRLYDPQSGAVLIDDQNISKSTLPSLRQAVSVVSQHPVLFDDTVRANIAFGRLDASEEAIIKAAEAASALTFIRALPHGFDTKVGENGNRLSGGQRQRISIARAILKDAPILLLDEATSALDSTSEAKVQKALANLSAGRTTLVIAHRLSTVQNADRILVLDQGQIVESGTHDELLAQKGAYAKLAKGQFH